MSRLARSEWIIEALAMRLAQRRDHGLSQALYVALRGWIQTGELKAGEALPSSRRLARELSVGRNTALAALERLAAEDLVVTRLGAGLFVAQAVLPETSQQILAPQHATLSRRGDRLLDFCATLSAGHHAFAPGIPALDLFPRQQWQRLLRRHQQRAPEHWFGYQVTGGLPALKRALCDYLKLSRSVRCRPEQILITQGAQQGFELIARLLADPGDSAWVEEPGYGGAQVALTAAGLSLMPIPVDADGMDLARAPAEAPIPKLIYVTPSHQYPRGVTLSLARRLALLSASERFGAWIIEDDYDSEFRYTTPPLASLQGLVEAAPVIYVGTFSKVLYPGLRLGYLVLPEALIESFQRANARLNREGQYVAQAALAEFIEQGHFSRHVARMRRAYRARQAALRQALLPATDQGLVLSEGHAGMHLLARLESLALERALIEAASRENIHLSPLSRYFAGPAPEAGLVLGYAGSSEQEIARAGAWLARTWQGLQK